MAYCRHCGTAIASDARFCPECGESVTPPAPGGPSLPAGHDTDAAASATAASVEQPVAGLGRRFVAHVVDGVLVFIMFWVIGSNVAESTGGTTEGGFELEGGSAILVIVLTLIAAIAYFSATEGAWRGQTLGKWLLGITVRDVSGAPCSFSQALTRNVLRLVDAFAFYIVGLVAALASADRQRVGDRVAGTVVVRVARKERAGQRDTGGEPTQRGKVRFSMGRGADVDI